MNIVEFVEKIRNHYAEKNCVVTDIEVNVDILKLLPSLIEPHELSTLKISSTHFLVIGGIEIGGNENVKPEHVVVYYNVKSYASGYSAMIEIRNLSEFLTDVPSEILYEF